MKFMSQTPCAWQRQPSELMKHRNISIYLVINHEYCAGHRDGFPSARFVLLKTFDERGFTFFTNYGSRKAKELEENPNVAASIYWLPLHRSVRIEGTAAKISREDSEKYFHARPRASQIGALASPQSEIIPSREYLDKIETDIKDKLGDGEVPLPNWGGYLITPRVIEFWQGQTNRLHDRIRFRKSDEDVDENLTRRAENGWVIIVYLKSRTSPYLLLFLTGD